MEPRNDQYLQIQLFERPPQEGHAQKVINIMNKFPQCCMTLYRWVLIQNSIYHHKATNKVMNTKYCDIDNFDLRIFIKYSFVGCQIVLPSLFFKDMLDSTFNHGEKQHAINDR